MDVGRGLATARDIQVTPTWRTAAHIDRVITLGQQASHRLHPLATPKIHTQIQDVTRLFVDHRLGQAKARNLGADKTARLPITVEHRDLIAQWRQVSRHGERRGPGAHAGDA